MSISDERHRFLDFLMRSALTAPGAMTAPVAGRVLAKLLVVVAIEGGNDLIMPYLVPFPGQAAGFEVRAYRAGSREPTDVRSSADAVAALRIAIRLAREGDVGVEVLSRNPAGLARCVFVRDSTGEFEFRHATAENLSGDPDQAALAEQEWQATLATWRAWVSSDHPVAISSDRVDRIGPVVAPFDQPTGSFDVLRFGDEPEPSVLSSSASRPTSPPSTDPHQGDQPSTDPQQGDQPSTDPPPTGRVAAPSGEAPTAGQTPPPRPLYEPLPNRRSAETDILIDAIHHGFANLRVEVDFNQIDRLIRGALDRDRLDLAERLARRMTTLLADALAMPDATELAASVAPLVPRPGDVADLVSARIGALLSEIVLGRGNDGSGQSSLLPGMNAAVERLQIQLDDLRDQVRRSTSVIEGFGDQLEASERRALVVEGFTESVDREMQRLAHNVDEQVVKLAANAGGGSELSDGVARLTRKLRQSVAQLDRALVRLDDVLDQTEAR